MPKLFDKPLSTKPLAGETCAPAEICRPDFACEFGRADYVGTQGKLAEVFLLAGSLRQTGFHAAVGRDALELPLENGVSLLDRWRHEIQGLSLTHGGLSRAVVLTGERSQLMSRKAVDRGDLSIECRPDASRFRGTGGILLDACAGMDPEAFIIVAYARQVLLHPLVKFVQRLREMTGDVRILCGPDGTPAGVYMVRVGCLSLLPKIGFIDWKEQGLALIAREHSVNVLKLPRSCNLVIRTPLDYLSAVRWHQSQLSAPDASENFKIVESGASVDPSARIHNSVVLRGAQIRADAVVVNSVVCGDGVVPSGQKAIHSLITARGC